MLMQFGVIMAKIIYLKHRYKFVIDNTVFCVKTLTNLYPEFSLIKLTHLNKNWNRGKVFLFVQDENKYIEIGPCGYERGFVIFDSNHNLIVNGYKMMSRMSYRGKYFSDYLKNVKTCK